MIKSILLVDDDSDDSELFSEALMELDSSVKFQRAIDGCDALTQLEKNKMKPDIIFLDINMPKMDGWECLTKLKNIEEYKDIPVIMYSTSSHKKDIESAAKLGASTFISKPESYKRLKEILKSVITLEYKGKNF
jgi:CheY-like chemotaxis protein